MLTKSIRFNSKSKQLGASAPLTIVFLGMLAVILTIAFKIYSPIFENWQVESVVESFENDTDLEDISQAEIEKRFTKRLLVNNVRNFNSAEGLYVSKEDGVVTIDVSYEVRVPIFRNIDAILKFEKILERDY